MGTVIGEKGITTILTNSETQGNTLLQGITNLQGNWKTQRKKEIEAIVTEIRKLRGIKETMRKILKEIREIYKEILLETTDITEMTEIIEIMTMTPEWTQGTETNTIQDRMFEKMIGKEETTTLKFLGTNIMVPGDTAPTVL